jgi:hypothetical protein
MPRLTDGAAGGVRLVRRCVGTRCPTPASADTWLPGAGVPRGLVDEVDGRHGAPSCRTGIAEISYLQPPHFRAAIAPTERRGYGVGRHGSPRCRFAGPIRHDGGAVSLLFFWLVLRAPDASRR